MSDIIRQLRIADLLVWAIAILIATANVTGAAISSPSPAVPPDSAGPSARIELKPLAPRHHPPTIGAISQTAPAAAALGKLAAQSQCLAEALYFEALAEGEAGDTAIAQMISRRLADGGHGGTICDVIHEGAGQTFCHFVFACDGSLDRPKRAEPWRAAQVLAARLLAGEIPLPDETGGALQTQKLAQISNRLFYRPPQTAPGTEFRGSLR